MHDSFTFNNIPNHILEVSVSLCGFLSVFLTRFVLFVFVRPFFISLTCRLWLIIPACYDQTASKVDGGGGEDGFVHAAFCMKIKLNI